MVVVSRGPPVAGLGLRLRVGEGVTKLLVVRVLRFWLSFKIGEKNNVV